MRRRWRWTASLSNWLAARQQQRALMEEDIDAILERAELVETREGEG